MPVSRTLFFSHWYRYWLMWEGFERLVLYERRLLRLDKLIEWAQRKRLTSVRNAYERQLLQTETTYQMIMFRHRRILPWARMYVAFWEQIDPA